MRVDVCSPGDLGGRRNSARVAAPQHIHIDVKTLTLSFALTVGAVALAPVAEAQMRLGNYDLQIEGRYDFHTWLWTLSPCGGACVHGYGIAMPIAKAYNYRGDAHLVDGRYTLTVDVPDGLRCGDIYYGPVIPTHDVYSWDAKTLAGTLESSFDTNCGGAPGGTYNYPFVLNPT
jgi:hypothetical protein